MSREAFEKIYMQQNSCDPDLHLAKDHQDLYIDDDISLANFYFNMGRLHEIEKAQAPVVPDILFDGYAVWEALPNRDAVHRKYVSDILDTIVRLLKESKS